MHAISVTKKEVFVKVLSKEEMYIDSLRYLGEWITWLRVLLFSNNVQFKSTAKNVKYLHFSR